VAAIVFMGTPEFAVPVLRLLVDGGHEVVAVVTQPDRPAGRGRALESPAVKRVALDLGLTVLQPESVNTTDFIDTLAALRPEVGVVAAFGQLLGRRVLAIPPYGYLNVHASLLPRHRGASPIAAAILAGDAETGVSIMAVEAGLDTGPVWARATCPIRPEDTTGILEERLAGLGASLLAQTLPDFLTGGITPTPQDERLATFAGRVEKNDGRADWSLSSERLWHMARAYNPWPGLFAFAGEQRLRLWRVRPLVDWRGGGAPGDVLPDFAGLVVATGQGALELEEVQLAGRGRVQGVEFKRGRRDLKKLT
jgi:methionyl-tRNA formyltransferase